MIIRMGVFILVLVVVVIIIRQAGGLVLWSVILPIRRLISTFPLGFFFSFPVPAIDWASAFSMGSVAGLPTLANSSLMQEGSLW